MPGQRPSASDGGLYMSDPMFYRCVTGADADTLAAVADPAIPVIDASKLSIPSSDGNTMSQVYHAFFNCMHIGFHTEQTSGWAVTYKIYADFTPRIQPDPPVDPIEAGTTPFNAWVLVETGTIAGNEVITLRDFPATKLKIMLTAAPEGDTLITFMRST